MPRPSGSRRFTRRRQAIRRSRRQAVHGDVRWLLSPPLAGVEHGPARPRPPGALVPGQARERIGGLRRQGRGQDRAVFEDIVTPQQACRPRTSSGPRTSAQAQIGRLGGVTLLAGVPVRRLDRELDVQDGACTGVAMHDQRPADGLDAVFQSHQARTARGIRPARPVVADQQPQDLVRRPAASEAT